MTQTNLKHQALARAYRPQVFSEVVGQEHVLQALAYSLDQQNIHHAYLLTGTRGVGKTTLGRLFAKALNCEQGISANPCGQCSACTSISAGRFVDLIEVDGASNTKVESTRELLEDVQFVPTLGRFKIYLIDEVHMLSTHSFNALLKTLEEPPEHVKFILATTDPQKLPITVLSRCLQLHLQLLSLPLIQQHLEFVLQQEAIEFEPRALYLLADAAQGSMRDALTLVDQARSQGQGRILSANVVAMLGILDQRIVHQLLSAALNSPPAEVFTILQRVESSGADSDQVLKDLIELCHQVAVAQALGEASTQALFIDPSLCQLIVDLAKNSNPAQLQLCFETLLSARKSLAYASSPQVAVRMAMLRMSCFQSFASDTVAPSETSEKKKPIDLLQITQTQATNNQPTNNQPTNNQPTNNQPTNNQPTATRVQHQVHTTQSKPVQQVKTMRTPEYAEPILRLLEARPWFEWVQKNSPGGLFGQLLYNSRITQLQQKDKSLRGTLVVCERIFSYDAKQTSQQASDLFRCVLGLDDVDIQCTQAKQVDSPPRLLQSQQQQQIKNALTARVVACSFIQAIQQQTPMTLKINNEAINNEATKDGLKDKPSIVQ